MSSWPIDCRVEYSLLLSHEFNSYLELSTKKTLKITCPTLNLDFVFLGIQALEGLGRNFFFFLTCHFFELEKNGEYLSEANLRGASCVDVRQNPSLLFSY